ncbi:MAG: sensor histidine kinase, partial [Bdellovibrionota bacterium]
PGISEDVQKRMFDPYFQGESPYPATKGFLGLGLTITKEVVEAHDGQIEYFPRHPSGSVFRIRLPLLEHE